MASERHHKWLLDLVKSPNNENRCADCGAEEPEWASINLGVFVCIACSGIHRFLGTHISKVRSMRLDTWTDELCQFMEENGNAKVNGIYECAVPVCYPRLSKDSPSVIREHYIRAKYERKEFMAFSARHFDLARDKPLKTGVLQKKGKEGTKWQARYLVLAEKLSYYKKETDKSELGVIDLSKCKIVLASDKAGKPFCFQLLDLSDDRSYFFHGDDGKEFMDWLHALRTAKALALKLNLSEITDPQLLSSMIDVDIIHEGALMKRAGARGGQWQKRWFMLDRQYVLYFKDSMAPFPVGKIPLGGYAGGWDLVQNEGDNEYQMSLRTPYTDETSAPRIYYLEASSKADKARWSDAIDQVIKSFGRPKSGVPDMQRLTLYDKDTL